jgi:hypothetical protein
VRSCTYTILSGVTSDQKIRVEWGISMRELISRMFSGSEGRTERWWLEVRTSLVVLFASLVHVRHNQSTGGLSAS